MARITAVAIQKGGQAKTTTAAALGAGLSLRGRRVLYIDLDAQGNLSYSLGADATGLTGASIMDVLQGTTSAAEAIQHTSLGDIISSSPALAGADTVLTAVGKEYRLKEALEGLAGAYDFIILDTPPSLGILTINALTAADDLLIPVQADMYSLQGLGQLWQTVQTIRKYCNPRLAIDGLLITRYNGRPVLSRALSDMLAQTAAQMGTKTYSSRIRECIALKEAVADKKDIYSYAPRSNAAADYSAFIAEFLEGEDIRQ